jgi:prolyl 4-hydroxylase
VNQIPPDWVRWIDENIMRGVIQQNIIDTLVHHKFDRNLATETVLSRMPGYLLQPRKAAPAQVIPEQDRPTAFQAQSQPAFQPQFQAEQFQYEQFGPKAGNTIKIGDHEVAVLSRIERPNVIVFGNIFTKEECEQLIELSKTKLARSTTVDDITGKAELHEHRTSSGTFFHLRENEFIAKLDDRVAALMQMPVTNGEGLQILNYQIGGEYKPHYDYFPPELPGSATHIAMGGQRIATLIIYLNSVPEGGETIFPNINLSVVPVQGSGVYFSYSNSRSQVDPLTYHGGNPVLKGEKWITTKWMRQRTYG